jgi:hypothetical protein
VADRDLERIPVAAPRPTRRAGRAPRDRDDASGAGLVLLALIMIITATGGWLGAWVGHPIPGGIMGCILGLPVAFAGVYTRYKRV